MSRFCPTAEELVNRYLKPKILGNDRRVSKIPELDVFSMEPWDLPEHLKVTPNDLEWYAFCPRYLNAGRPNRKSNVGNWRETGKSRQIKANGVTGTRKIFVFYVGDKNTKFVLHEFSAAIDPPTGQRTFVLCKIMKRANKKITVPKGETSGTPESVANDEAPEEVDPEFLSHLESFYDHLLLCDEVPEEVGPEDPKYPEFLAHLNCFSACMGQVY